jgi:hypothetical protein
MLSLYFSLLNFSCVLCLFCLVLLIKLACVLPFPVHSGMLILVILALSSSPPPEAQFMCCRHSDVVCPLSPVMADLIRHPRRPRGGAIGGGFTGRVVIPPLCCSFPYCATVIAMYPAHCLRHPRAEQVDVRDLLFSVAYPPVMSIHPFQSRTLSLRCESSCINM